MALPSFIDVKLAHDLLAHFASQEPAGPLQSPGSNWISRSRQHQPGMCFEEGEADIKADIKPVAYTATGLRFSDGSHVDVDAVIWCTGFADKNAREAAVEILGGSASQASSSS
ncbi:hypothetical protein ACN38_g11141 [Penicillium nordicum]|uniref:FAD/NAD(P)-binding domain-containing protein n=1 Tax=Penicillium nordicum TaxID=229535 RepID=A0A0M9WB82_9EURO|nr:hypothetical protein ACN38_g11141 [Penicillium nordicum]